MRISKTFAVLLLAALTTQTATAQSRKPDVSGLAAQCLQTTCHRAVNASIRRMIRQTETEDEFNSRLGDLAAALFETARDADTVRSRRRISTAIARLARYTSDREQKKSFLWIAREIRKGDGALFDLDDPFAVSPS
ncbi:MAG: hypothetical protein ACU0CA_10190 [Paracoccaceae bacterium]